MSLLLYIRSVSDFDVVMLSCRVELYRRKKLVEAELGDQSQGKRVVLSKRPAWDQLFDQVGGCCITVLMRLLSLFLSVSLNAKDSQRLSASIYINLFS